jgi:carbon storage regulator CsrA
MLVLTRKQGEKVVIGDNIMVGVVQVAGNKVVLSFDAPGEVRILRAELGTWQDRYTARHLDPSDPDLKERPTEWEELNFSPAQASNSRPASASNERPKKVQK